MGHIIDHEKQYSDDDGDYDDIKALPQWPSAMPCWPSAMPCWASAMPTVAQCHALRAADGQRWTSAMPTARTPPGLPTAAHSDGPTGCGESCRRRNR